jgi:hypothetical protein
MANSWVRKLSEHNWQIKTLCNKVGVKYYEHNIVAREMYCTMLIFFFSFCRVLRSWRIHL